MLHQAPRHLSQGLTEIIKYDGSLTPRESHAPNCSEDLVIEVTPTEILSYLQLFVKHKQIDIYENYSPRQQIPSRTVTSDYNSCRLQSCSFT